MVIKFLFVNVFTLIRIIGSILLIPIYYAFGGKWAGLLSLFCYLTDSIDGILSRKWKVATFFGALFDGVADKLFTIINCIVLCMITPYALIPIIIELLTIIIQFVRFNCNLNIQSNNYGKIKIWVLAITIVLIYFIKDINNIMIIPSFIKVFINNIYSPELFLIILIPTIIIELLTFLDYFISIFTKKNMTIIKKQNKKIDSKKLYGKDFWNYFKKIWISPDFYEKHKNDTNLKDLRKLSREN